MKAKIDEIEKQLTQGAERFVSAEEAAYFARLMVEAHLRKFPKMNPLEEAVTDLKVWQDAKEREISLDADRESILLTDFKGLAGTLKLKYIHDEAERRSRKNGVAVVGIRNTSGLITLTPWSYGLAERDCIAICSYNGGVRCGVPYGGTRGFFGTLPLTYAIPGKTGPIIFDMATTEIPYFQIPNSKKEGKSLPEGSVLDKEGKPTTDPNATTIDDTTVNMLPMGGGIKGYGLMFLLEVLTGSLVRSLMSTEQTPGWNPAEYGGIILALNVGSFTGLEGFKDELAGLVQALKSQTPAEGFKEVPIPGDRGGRKAEEARKAGEIEVKEEVLKDLASLSQS